LKGAQRATNIAVSQPQQWDITVDYRLPFSEGEFKGPGKARSKVNWSRLKSGMDHQVRSRGQRGMVTKDQWNKRSIGQRVKYGLVQSKGHGDKGSMDQKVNGSTGQVRGGPVKGQQGTQTFGS
jgi:hypothetical protein